jgi:hypothetical protein
VRIFRVLNSTDLSIVAYSEEKQRRSRHHVYRSLWTIGRSGTWLYRILLLSITCTKAAGLIDSQGTSGRFV